VARGREIAIPDGTGDTVYGVAVFHVSLELRGKVDRPPGLFGDRPSKSLAVSVIASALLLVDVLRGSRAGAVGASGLLLALILAGGMGCAACISNPPVQSGTITTNPRIPVVRRRWFGRHENQQKMVGGPAISLKPAAAAVAGQAKYVSLGATTHAEALGAAVTSTAAGTGGRPLFDSSESNDLGRAES
jgi:hypothetical protein